MQIRQREPAKAEPDRLKHFAKESPGVKLGALFVERSPDILGGLAKACMGLACLLAVIAGGGAITWVWRFLNTWP